MNDKLTRSIPLALTMAKRTIEFVKSADSKETMINFFKGNDAKTKNAVISRLNAVVKALETQTRNARLNPYSNTVGKIQCAEPTASGGTDYNWCSRHKALAMTDPANGRVTFCPIAKPYPVEFVHCDDGGWPGTIIHELTHSRIVMKPNTVDTAYAANDCKALSAQKALLNANNFNFLAESAMQGMSC